MIDAQVIAGFENEDFLLFFYFSFFFFLYPFSFPFSFPCICTYCRTRFEMENAQIRDYGSIETWT